MNNPLKNNIHKVLTIIAVYCNIVIEGKESTTHTDKPKGDIKMTNTLEILEVLKVDGETMYLLEGNIKAREIDILEFALHGTNFILSEDVEYVAMDYVEVFHSLDGGNEIDIYVHDVLITHDNDTEIDSEGRLIKTYLRESSAMKFANSLNTTKVITSN